MNPLFRAMDSYGRCTASTKEWQTVRSLEPKILSTVYITKAFFFKFCMRKSFLHLVL